MVSSAWVSGGEATMTASTTRAASSASADSKARQPGAARAIRSRPLGARVVGGGEPGVRNPGEGGQMQALRRAAAAEDAEEDRRVHGRVLEALRGAPVP